MYLVKTLDEVNEINLFFKMQIGVSFFFHYAFDCVHVLYNFYSVMIDFDFVHIFNYFP